MSIMEKAKSLGEAIVESSEYEELKTAETNMYEDEEAKTLLDEFSAKQKRLQMAQSNGKAITPEDQKDLQSMQAKMQANEKVNAFMEAQQKFNQIMQTVNQTISSVMTGNA
ncbi:YlbF family regulator [Natronospora cellulosivora (SeqCode)]